MNKTHQQLPTIPGFPHATNVKEVIQYNCKRFPEKIALKFLNNGETDEQDNLTYLELDDYAKSILSIIRSVCGKGERVLILLPSGHEFVASFVACLYGGFVAVPVAIPTRRDSDWARVLSIVKDCSPKAVIASGNLCEKLEQYLQSEYEDTLEIINADNFTRSISCLIETSEIKAEDLAFLQYTSGSTGNPKGVMVSHRNLIHNQQLIQLAFSADENSKTVSWLPLFHDMGLIGAMIRNLYIGSEFIYMAPVSFIQRPARWLQAISQFGANHSSGPNFAYDLCVERYNPSDYAKLDLASWSGAFNGAEPIRTNTIDNFCKTFGPHGFNHKSMTPVYGLAEGVLLVTAAQLNSKSIRRAVDREHYSRGLITQAAPGQKALTLISAGQVIGDQELAIIEPQDFTVLPSDQVGEIWISGTSVADGYWGKKDLNSMYFRAKHAVSERAFLRSGDLGFLDKNNNLYITGRLKDTIIVSGHNYYPQDIEFAVESLHQDLISGGCAVVSIDVDGQERIVVLQEVSRRASDLNSMIKDIRLHLATEFRLVIYDVCLLKQKTLLKTTSGKIQRSRNRQAYLEGNLNILAQFKNARSEELKLMEKDSTSASDKSSESIFLEVKKWIDGNSSNKSYVSPKHLFVDLGMDSVDAQSLALHLSNLYDVKVDVMMVWDYPEIYSFCSAVSTLLLEPKEGISKTKQKTSQTKRAPNVFKLDDEEFTEILKKELS